MKTSIKKSVLATSLLAAMTGSAFAQEGIKFDPDGAGGAFGDQIVGSFDWGGANILAQNCIPVPATGAGGCTIYVQTKLSALLSPTEGNLPGPHQGVTPAAEYTMVMRVKADSAAANVLDPAKNTVGSGVQFSDTNLVDALNNKTGAAVPDGLPDLFGDATSFFEIWYDRLGGANPDGGVTADPISGNGYRDGTKILSGTVGIESFAVILLNATIGPIDQSTSGNGVDQSLPLVDSYQGVQGSARFQVNVTPGVDTVDTNFFKDPFNINAGLLRIDIDDNGRSSLPFTATEPSQKIVGQTPSFGALGGGGTSINNFNCDGAAKGTTCDLLLEGDPKSVFKHDLPEPGSVALIGLGLGAMGWFSRRRLAKSV